MDNELPGCDQKRFADGGRGVGVISRQQNACGEPRAAENVSHVRYASNGRVRVAPFSATCLQIQELRARHKMWLRQRVRMVNTACALIARMLGDRGGQTSETERARYWTRACLLFKQFSSGKELPESTQTQLSSCVGDLLQFQRSLAPTMAALDDCERGLKRAGKEMRERLGLSAIKGFGDLAFGVLVGEVGDFSNYPRARLIYKRLGLIPFDGKAGKTWKTLPKNAPRHLTADEWKKYGYDGRRLAAVYGYLLDPLFKHQWESEEKSDIEGGRPKGPYGEVYACRKKHTEITHPDWTKGHRRQDALRVMAQAVIRDTWLEWRAKTGEHAAQP